MPGLGELVPWADRETIVAAEDAVADQRAQFLRDRPLMLDRQIRDAAPRIELIGGRKGICRAAIEAAPASTAMIFLPDIRFELEAQIDLAEKQPGAVFARHEVRVLALPTDPGLLRQRLLHDRRGVDKDLELARPALGDPARQRLQPLFDRVVIILPACIDRDDAGFGIGLGGKRILAAVIEPENDNAARLDP